MSLKDLEPNGLFVLLFLRTDLPVQNDFHWALYLHGDSSSGGTKYHIKQQGSGWITDHGTTYGVFKSFLLIGLFQIATIRAGWESYVDSQLRTYDPWINTPGISCDIWVFWVLRLLQQPVNGYRILNCDDLDELANEIKEWGNGYSAAAVANRQPRPIGRSSKSHVCIPVYLFPNRLLRNPWCLDG